MRRAHILTVIALGGAMPALAQSAPMVERAVYLESGDGMAGAAVQRLEPSARLTRGDRIVTVLSWGQPPANGMKLTSAVPARLQVQSASRDGVEISSDGGKTWHRLADADAIPAGVTHLRWPLGRDEGSLTYRAVVR